MSDSTTSTRTLIRTAMTPFGGIARRSHDGPARAAAPVALLAASALLAGALVAVPAAAQSPTVNPTSLVTISGVPTGSPSITHEINGAGYGDVANVVTQVVSANDDPAPEPQIPSVTIRHLSTRVVEGNRGAWAVVLDARPTEPVTVVATSSNPDLAMPTGPVTFTREDWYRWQIVTVGTVNDNIDQDDRTVTISHQAMGGGYDGLGIDEFTVTLVDDDTVGVTVTASELTVTEAAGDMQTAEYMIVLESEPVGDVTITPMSSDEAAVMVSGPLAFTPGDWNVPQTVTVTGIDDYIDQGLERMATISHQASGADYEGFAVAAVAVTLTDDDMVGITVSTAALTVTEAAGESQTAEYTIVLESEPVGDVTITPASSDEGAVSVSGALTFTPANWNVPQTVTVTGMDDLIDQESDRVATISHAVMGADYGDVPAANVEVTLTDDDMAGVTVEPTALTMVEGDTGSYTVVLTSEPVNDVTITATSGDRDLAAVTAPLTFTAADWSTPQTFGVTAGDDFVDDEGDRIAVISHDVTGYGWITTADAVSVTVEDDDDRIRDPAMDALLMDFTREITGMVTESISGRVLQDTEHSGQMMNGDAFAGGTGIGLGLGNAAGTALGAFGRGPGLGRPFAVGSSGFGSGFGQGHGMNAGFGAGPLMAGPPTAATPRHGMLGGGFHGNSYGYGGHGGTMGQGFGAMGQGFGGLGYPGAGLFNGGRMTLATFGAQADDGGDEAMSMGSDTGFGALWFSGNYRSLSGRYQDTASWSGDITAGQLGIDMRAGDWVAGVSSAWTESRADYRGMLNGTLDGDVRLDLTSIHPYAGWTGNKLAFWGTVGGGSGTWENNRDDGILAASDVDYEMGAMGWRLSPGACDKCPKGFSLHLKGDFSSSTLDLDETVRTPDMSLTGERTRFLLEMQWDRGVREGGGKVVTTLEGGARHDGGEGNNGVGMEVGGAIRYRHARGLLFEGRVSGVFAHSSGYDDWGVSGRLEMPPRQDGTGMSAAFQSIWGMRPGLGAESLWTQGLNRFANAPGAFGQPATLELDSELGYGLRPERTSGRLVRPFVGARSRHGGLSLWRSGIDFAVPRALIRTELFGGPYTGDSLRIAIQPRWKKNRR